MTQEFNVQLTIIAQKVDEIRARVLQGNYNTAADLAALEQYLERSRKIAAPVLEAQTLLVIGMVRVFDGAYEQALEMFQTAEQLAMSHEAYDQAFTAMNYIAVTYKRLGKSELAAQTHEQGIALCKQIPNQEHSAISFHLNAGNAYMSLYEQAKAELHFRECLALYEMLDAKRKHTVSRRIVAALTGLAQVEAWRGNTAEARLQAKAALESAQKTREPSVLIMCYFTLLRVAYKAPESPTEFDDYRRELDAYVETQLAGGRVLGEIAHVYLVEARYWGMDGLPEMARQFATRAHELFTLIGDANGQAEAQRFLKTT